MRVKKEKLHLEWLKKAADDELSINAILSEKGAPSTVSFLAQQLAEKYLKAFLVFHGKSFPKVHQLELLLALCKEIDPLFSELGEDAVLLTEYYIETRYPGDFPEIFWKDARICYAAAKRIKEFIDVRLL